MVWLVIVETYSYHQVSAPVENLSFLCKSGAEGLPAQYNTASMTSSQPMMDMHTECALGETWWGKYAMQNYADLRIMPL